MATANQNLSAYDKEKLPDASGFKVGVVVSEWNHEVTGNLLEGCRSALLDLGVKEDDLMVHWVPGSFELPLGARWLLEHGNVQGVVCLGSVIQGETRHFDFVCEAVSMGIKDVSLATGKPVIFGVLTDNTLDQAKARSGGEHGNKGTEAAVSVVKMIHLQQQITKPKGRIGY